MAGPESLPIGIGRGRMVLPVCEPSKRGSGTRKLDPGADGLEWIVTQTDVCDEGIVVVGRPG